MSSSRPARRPPNMGRSKMPPCRGACTINAPPRISTAVSASRSAACLSPSTWTVASDSMSAVSTVTQPCARRTIKLIGPLTGNALSIVVSVMELPS